MKLLSIVKCCPTLDKMNNEEIRKEWNWIKNNKIIGIRR